MNRKTDDLHDKISELHENDILVEQREIFLYECDKEADYEINTILAMKFLKNLRLLESINDNEIFIHLFSAGGAWDAGLSIYDSIKNANSHITIICHGMVASIATIILQAADRRLSMPNAEFLIHEGTTGIHADLINKQAKSRFLSEQKKEELLYEIYIEKCLNAPFFQRNKSNRQSVRNFLKSQLDKREDWFLNPEEALNYGFIDDIVGSKTCPKITV